MASKILRLSEEVINQIAAGEVIENPASIVKELIENSLDAGARHLEIAIEGGGLVSIQIEDDGSGMNEEEALLCLERHATSKIRRAEDLEALTTMGFRGEALAAIAAVSCLNLKTHDGLFGTSVEVEGGRILAVLPCARNQGTTISVRSLFFNTPARKKFLKAPAANTSAVIRMVETLALAHPEVAFVLVSGGEIVLQTTAEDWKKRVERILGEMPIEISSSSIQGLLSSPDTAKSHRRGQYLFINRRPIFSPLISRAVKMGYGTRLSENSHPCFALFLEISPQEIDVNVHPQKKEVRFSDEKRMFHLFQRAVSRAFGDEGPSFSEPLFFTKPNFSCREDPTPFTPQNLSATPLTFNFPKIDRPLAVIDYFLLLERDEIFLINLKAAQARVLFETFRGKKEVGIQKLLEPIEMKLEDDERLADLSDLGIEWRQIGKHTIAIDALPVGVDPSGLDHLIRLWQKGKKMDLALSDYCHHLKKKYTLDEAVSLWESLQNCDECQLDPEGKPIWVQLKKENLQILLD